MGMVTKKRLQRDSVELARRKNTEYHSYDKDEQFSLRGEPLFSVFDFWKYHYSHLVGETGKIGEFLVAKALGIDKAENVLSWSAYDMSYRGARIEVKSTAYVHPWNESEVSRIRTFSIAPSKNEYWALGIVEADNHSTYARQSDIYVFCLNINQIIENDDPLRVDDWEFYVVPTSAIDEYTQNNNNPLQKTISLNVIKKLSGDPIPFEHLKGKIDEAVDLFD